MTRVSRAALLGACLQLAAACAAHRQVEPTLIPAPLVTALVSDRAVVARTAPVYSVGTLPPGYPSTLVPGAPARIVGGMSNTDQLTVVFADTTRRLAPILDELFQHAGFTRPPSPPRSGFSNGGPDRFNFFCSDSAYVSAEQLAGANRNLVRVTYRPYRGNMRCPVSAAPQRQPEELTIPALTAPPGVHVGRSGGGSGSADVHSNAEVTGSGLVPSAILAHYAAQLTAAGWHAAPAAISDRLAAQFFEATTPSGSTWEGVLMAVGGGNALTLSLNMNPRGIR
ncbi:MAG TPA: hypothetical protein VN706_12840 [Gemmatimonadaceae bacterium]|nr:hypothetical protein [Gemmatimonadaceae bacterium]